MSSFRDDMAFCGQNGNLIFLTFQRVLRQLIPFKFYVNTRAEPLCSVCDVSLFLSVFALCVDLPEVFAACVRTFFFFFFFFFCTTLV